MSDQARRDEIRAQLQALSTAIYNLGNASGYDTAEFKAAQAAYDAVSNPYNRAIMRKYTAVFADGRVTKRTSDQLYTHAYGSSFAGSLELALKAAKGDEVVAVSWVWASPKARAQMGLSV
jgi:hypothetical protein